MKLSLRLLNWWWNSVVKNGDDKRIATLTPIKNVDEINNLDYFGDKSKWHLMDIYRPQDKINQKLPVIIDIHGGGWMYGDKELNKNYCLSLATRGFAVVNFSYSLFPSVTFPTPVQEIFKAINFVYQNAEKYNLDKDNMFLTGDSAGGHYSGLVLSIICDDNLQKLYDVSTPAKFKGVGFTCAAFKPNDIGNMCLPLAKDYVRLFYNNDKKFKENKFYKSNDIINNKVENFPPMFINSCYNDMLKKQTQEFVKCLDDKKIPYVLDFPEKQDCKNKMGHVYSVLYPNDWEESKKTNDNLCNFFKQYIV